MRKFTTPSFSPDGFSGGSASRQRDVVANAYSTISTLAEASRRADPAPAMEMADCYDEGLVHEHHWARSSAA